MTRKKFYCMFGAGFLLAIAVFTGLFLIVLQSDPSASLPPDAAASSGPTAFQAISGGDLYMLLGLVAFLLLFFYFVFKG